MAIPSSPPPFTRLVSDHATALAGFLRGFVGPDDADECLQETFLAALRSYDSFDGRHPRAWLFAIARRKAIDSRRAEARRPQPTDDTERLIAPAPAAESDPFDPGIWAEVADLPDKQRAALVLRYGLDLPHREIGDALGCSEAAARRSVHEGIAKLREPRIPEVA